MSFRTFNLGSLQYSTHAFISVENLLVQLLNKVRESSDTAAGFKARDLVHLNFIGLEV